MHLDLAWIFVCTVIAKEEKSLIGLSLLHLIGVTLVVNKSTEHVLCWCSSVLHILLMFCDVLYLWFSVAIHTWIHHAHMLLYILVLYLIWAWCFGIFCASWFSGLDEFLGLCLLVYCAASVLNLCFNTFISFNLFLCLLRD